MLSGAWRPFWIGWSSLGFLHAIRDDRPDLAVVHSVCLAVCLFLILWDRVNDEVRNG